MRIIDDVARGIASDSVVSSIMSVSLKFTVKTLLYMLRGRAYYGWLW